MVTQGDTSPWLDEVVDRLRGQCVIDFEMALEEVGVEATDENIELISEKVFLCSGCGWYSEVEDLYNTTGEDLCDECTEENDDGDD